MAIRKLSLTINAFDATELLEQLISEIRDQVDHVAAIWQKKSYWKNPINPQDFDELKRLEKLGLIDELIEFKPNFLKYSREQECEKRNMGIELMKQNGSTHILNIDADELYDADQFRFAKDLINKKGYNITYCSYVNYYKDFEHYLVYPFRPFVPFIHRTYFKYQYSGPAPGPTDPTRRINNPFGLGEYVFPDEEIRMGHASWIRKDIRTKLANWSAKNHFDDKDVENAVNRWNNWKGPSEQAYMLFNVPEKKVNVKKLDQKIHKFNVPWLKNGKWEY
jgi:hypothetical protein